MESNNDLNPQVSNVANQLATYKPEALAEFKKTQWEESHHWDDLLAQRAAISGRLALSNFTKTQLKKFNKAYNFIQYNEHPNTH